MAYERLLAYFDILGFKSLVLRDPLEKMVERFGHIYTTIGAAAVRHEAAGQDALSVAAIADRYNQIESFDLAGVRSAFEDATQMTLLIMSDSVIMYSTPLAKSDERFRRQLSAMLRISRTVLEKLLEYQLPARGAISYGEFYADSANGIYVGRALVEAYETAESQEWIGAVAAESLSGELASMHQSFTMEDWRKNRWLARGVRAGCPVDGVYLVFVQLVLASYVSAVVAFAAAYRLLNIEHAGSIAYTNGEPLTTFGEHLYFSAVTMATLGTAT